MTNQSSEDNSAQPVSFGPTDTFIVNNKQVLRRMLESTHEDEETSSREILLLIRGMSERLPMTDNLSVVVGRSDLKTGYTPDVDLTPYGAQNRGVSRSHARLYVEDQQLYVVDLDSANGTFVTGERLPPDEPRLIRKGDSLMLGSLVIQIHF